MKIDLNTKVRSLTIEIGDLTTLMLRHEHMRHITRYRLMGKLNMVYGIMYYASQELDRILK